MESISCKNAFLIQRLWKIFHAKMPFLFRDYGKYFMQKCLPYSETMETISCKNAFLIQRLWKIIIAKEIYSFINSVFRELGQITLRKLVHAEETIETFIGTKLTFLYFHFRSKHTLWVHRGGSNEYPQCMFWIKNKKIRYTPANPSFSI